MGRMGPMGSGPPGPWEGLGALGCTMVLHEFVGFACDCAASIVWMIFWGRRFDS